MDNPRILLIGAGGHCRSCIDVVEQEDRYCIAGIVDKVKVKTEVEANVLGYQVIGTDDDLPELRKKYRYALVTVGQIKSPDVRIRLFDMLLELGFELPTIVSPLAYVSPHAVIGQGTIVMHHALVNAGSRVGSNCIINSKALVEHDAVIEDHCHIATGAVVNGGVLVQGGSFVGSNAVIREGIRIGKRCIIGAGARVLADLVDGAQHIG